MPANRHAPPGRSRSRLVAHAARRRYAHAIPVPSPVTVPPPPAANPPPPPPPPRLTFGADRRLTKDREFQAVFAARCSCQRGPLTFHARTNALGRTRLGLSVGKRVGGAVVRNRVKRLLREAFRLTQHDLPPGLDLVASARPHSTSARGTLERYRAALTSAATTLAAELARRAEKAL